MEDIWIKVSEHVKPNPLMYTKLAEVSRQFHRVFTSDRLWACLNVYEVDADIASTFNQRCNNLTDSEKQLLVGYYKGHQQSHELGANLDLDLAYYVNCKLESCESINDYRMAMCAIQVDPMALLKCNETLKRNKRLSIAAIQRNPDVFTYCTSHFKDKEVVLAAMRMNGSMFHLVSEHFKYDKEVILAACSSFENTQGMYYPNWCPLSSVPKEMIDREVAIVAANQHSFALQFIPYELLFDPVVIMDAVKRMPLAGRFIPNEIKFDKEVLKASLPICNDFEFNTILSAMPHAYRHDEKFMGSLLERNGRAYPYLGNTLKNDRGMLLLAVKTWGKALEFARQKWCSDIEIVRHALSNYGPALEFVSRDLRQNKDLVLLAVSNDGTALRFAGKYKSDPQVVETAVQNDGLALMFASPELRNDATIVTAAIANNPSSIAHASPELQQQLGGSPESGAFKLI